jgi:hypothetical protein
MARSFPKKKVTAHQVTSDDLEIDSGTLSIDADNNRVGVNTTSPGATLGIDGDIQLAPTATSTGHITSTGSLNVRASNNIRIGDDGADSVRLGRINTSAAKVHIRSGADTDLVVSGSKVGIGTDEPKTDLTVEGPITLKEQAAADSDTAAYGQLWVKTATPNELYFTTDAGDDIQITSGTATAFVGDITGVTAGNGLSGGGTSGALSLALDLNELSAAAVNVANDSIVIVDADDSNGSKKESIADLATAMAGTGLSASSGQLTVDSITSVGTISTGVWQGTAIAQAYVANDSINGDKIADDSINSEHYVDGSIDTAHIADDQVTLAKMAGLARGKFIVGDSSGNPSALAAGANGKILVADANGDPSWTTLSGDASLSAGALTIATGAVEHAMLGGDCVDGDNIADDSINSEHYVDGSIDTAHIADDQVTLAKMAGITRGSIIIGNASGNPALLGIGSNNYVLTSDGTDIAWAEASGGGSIDLNGLSAATVAVAADSIAIIDANDSNASRKESIADFVSAIAGTGFSASSGVLNLNASTSANGLAANNNLPGGAASSSDQIIAIQVFS